MDDHIHIHIRMLLTTISIVPLLLLLTTLPPSVSEQPPSNNYSACSQNPYNCATLSDIYYPFWGENRPFYCGGGEQFLLTCNETGQYSSIQIGSQKFMVLKVDAQANTMWMAALPLEYEFCSMEFNFSLSPFFWYSKSVNNITIFYNCPSGVSNEEDNYNFTCPGTSGSNENQKVVYYEGMVDEVMEQHPELKKCGRSFQLPTNKTSLNPNAAVNVQTDEAIAGGFHVKYVVSQECIGCVGSEGVCGTNSTRQFTCYCPDGLNALTCTVHHRNRWRWKFSHVVIGFILTVIPGLMLIYITICCFRRESSRWEEIFSFTAKRNQDIEAMLKTHGALKRYSFSDVRKMTNSFRVKLGKGGFGDVYKGRLLTNGCHVAVKILNQSKKNGEEFMNEIASISRTSHVNVVALLGFCLEGSKKALIYEFMSNGSLDKFIYNKRGSEITPSLSWDNLYQIAKGIARGLEYLHRGCNTRILHFDIKPHNILLDENLCPKISDFGLAKLCPMRKSIVSMSNARGTIGYVAPEVWNRHFGGVSHKSDVYSYGMMLLEMVGGRKNINAEASHTSEIYFPNWIYGRLEQGTQLGLDGDAATIEENEVVKRMILVGLWCIQTIPNNRPTMSRVIEMLEGNINFLEMPPKPNLSSPIRSVAESSATVN